jgi:hypothetical protein
MKTLTACTADLAKAFDLSQKREALVREQRAASSQSPVVLVEPIDSGGLARNNGNTRHANGTNPPSEIHDTLISLPVGERVPQLNPANLE